MWIKASLWKIETCWKNCVIRNLIITDSTLFVRKYQQKVYWHIRKMVIDHDDADDLTLEVLFSGNHIPGKIAEAPTGRSGFPKADPAANRAARPKKKLVASRSQAVQINTFMGTAFKL